MPSWLFKLRLCILIYCFKSSSKFSVSIRLVFHFTGVDYCTCLLILEMYTMEHLRGSIQSPKDYFWEAWACLMYSSTHLRGYYYFVYLLYYNIIFIFISYLTIAATGHLLKNFVTCAAAKNTVEHFVLVSFIYITFSISVYLSMFVFTYYILFYDYV